MPVLILLQTAFSYPGQLSVDPVAFLLGAPRYLSLRPSPSDSSSQCLSRWNCQRWNQPALWGSLSAWIWPSLPALWQPLSCWEYCLTPSLSVALLCACRLPASQGTAPHKCLVQPRRSHCRGQIHLMMRKPTSLMPTRGCQQEQHAPPHQRSRTHSAFDRKSACMMYPSVSLAIMNVSSWKIHLLPSFCNSTFSSTVGFLCGTSAASSSVFLNSSCGDFKSCRKSTSNF